MTDWAPGTRVDWESSAYGRLTGTVAPVAPWPPLDRVVDHAQAPRIPVDLDTPLHVSIGDGAGGKTITRLYVRAPFLRRLREGA